MPSTGGGYAEKFRREKLGRIVHPPGAAGYTGGLPSAGLGLGIPALRPAESLDDPILRLMLKLQEKRFPDNPIHTPYPPSQPVRAGADALPSRSLGGPLPVGPMHTFFHHGGSTRWEDQAYEMWKLADAILNGGQ